MLCGLHASFELADARLQFVGSLAIERDFTRTFFAFLTNNSELTKTKTKNK
jgi:hypothetical protein